MIKFGPSGTGISYHNEGNSGTAGAAKWLSRQNLDAFEYSFGRGVNIKKDTARAIGAEFEKFGIEISVHAPYYINLAGEDETKLEKSVTYIIQSLNALRSFGGKRCVFHPGSPMKQDRREAMLRAKKTLERVIEAKNAAGFEDLYLCVETMGKIAQLGTVDEIIELCSLDKSLLPCADFGHINAREHGSLKNYDDFSAVIEKFAEGLGREKANEMHVHFSKIMYSAGGEVKHLTFEDTQFGPDFEPFARALVDFGIEPYVICESAGTQAEDAVYMKRYYNGLLAL